LTSPLTLHPLHPGIVQVVDIQGCQVGNLRLIGGRWKFKAVGHDEDGAVIPGGGPLTARHNMTFEQWDETDIVACLLGD
jgi:hypothetical protein